MSIIVVRHGLSEANNRNVDGTPAFGNKDAPLMEQGRIAARKAGLDLLSRYGICPPNTPAATSELVRTQQTARLAGFHILQSYALLNEVEHGLSLEQKRQVRINGVVPPEAIAAAEDVLANPPSEEIWFTHGLLIAGLCKVLDVYQGPDDRIIPHFCEIRELDI